MTVQEYVLIVPLIIVVWHIIVAIYAPDEL